MKYLLFILLFGNFQLLVYSQVDFQTIKVSNDIELIKLSENAYVHVSWFNIPEYGRFPANGLIFINKDEAFLLDTPWNDSLTMELYAWITDTMKIKIMGFIPNHWHEDCMGGLCFLQKQNIRSYANQTTIDVAMSKNLPVPEIGFKDSLQVQLGDKRIECYYLGEAHSIDNIVVCIPSEQILFAGCMVKSLNSVDLGNTRDGNLKEYPKTIKKLLSKFPEAKIVVPGHGQIGSQDLIVHTQALLNK